MVDEIQNLESQPIAEKDICEHTETIEAQGDYICKEELSDSEVKPETEMVGSGTNRSVVSASTNRSAASSVPSRCPANLLAQTQGNIISEGSVCPAGLQKQSSAYGGATGAGYCLAFLVNIRESLAEYQEKKGIPKNETFTFFTLIYMVAQYVYSVSGAIAAMVINLMPLVDAFLLIMRFLVDKLIAVIMAEHADKVIKSIVLLFEFVALTIMMIIMYGLIIFPLSSLFIALMKKCWNFIY